METLKKILIKANADQKSRKSFKDKHNIDLEVLFHHRETTERDHPFITTTELQHQNRSTPLTVMCSLYDIFYIIVNIRISKGLFKGVL